MLLGASLAGASAHSSAQTASVEQSKVEWKTPVGEEPTVSMELLEFLGEWEAGNGEWVDPGEVQSADWPAMSKDSAESSDEGTGNAH